ncbi:alpha,alpha-trehalase TreF [Larsenimonas suaedae]|uniref:Alpha,alpha-trehalase TreF n=1 Tax=Larsenimonas suaedae TaxID=1851019 RepID=A0ABU1GRU1_9GAMM|nr:alpha,alpha-trehalase TreF [Larsenimonas suaedae]MCM2972466.1 alpha,alpha-trehalase TreF [Larsenimonas suaedae]MDR5894738.1 alpha,alpha-trehalase TreF [Larsenimonas suaedae]
MLNHRGLRAPAQWVSVLLCAVVLSGCAAFSAEPTPKRAAHSPEQWWGPVMTAVAEAELYPDGKTVVDLIPKRDPEVIVSEFEAKTATGPLSRPALVAFVKANFDEPPANESHLEEPANTPVAQHIRNLWPVLTRRSSEVSANPYSSLVGLPHPYVVPGGRFNEMFYWDSYFTMVGLARSERFDLVRDMVENFAWLIDRYGFIPNGTRTYFLTRSQPPFFASMVSLLAQKDGNQVYRRYLPELMAEYRWWMRGAEELAPGSAGAHVVKLADGTVLNRYSGGENRPRAESYAGDREVAEKSTRPANEIYGNLRAAAESGWDFSSRWMADGTHQTSINTRALAPVDLNALMFDLEKTLAQAWAVKGDAEQARTFAERAEHRRQAINRVFWDSRGFYTDYNWRAGEPTYRITAAMVFPLAFGIATPAQADATAATVRSELLRPGGLVTTPRNTGEQWDAPNGWAPLQWLAVRGLERYGHIELARTIATRWIDTNERVYRETGKLVEKYDVESAGVGGGGEYEVVDGFGWTNGVLLDFLASYGPNAEARATSERARAVRAFNQKLQETSAAPAP